MVEGVRLGTPGAGERAVNMDPYLAIQVIMMPRDTNPHGTIFGGVILAIIDQAGAIGARREVVPPAANRRSSSPWR